LKARFGCCTITNNGWLEIAPKIAAKIGHGFSQAERGELLDGEAPFRQLRQRHDQHRKQR
jgi:hypothetical protein